MIGISTCRATVSLFMWVAPWAGWRPINFRNVGIWALMRELSNAPASAIASTGGTEDNDPKTRVCTAFEAVSKAVPLQTNRDLGPDPCGAGGRGSQRAVRRRPIPAEHLRFGNPVRAGRSTALIHHRCCCVWTIRRVGRDRHCDVECVTEHARQSRGIRPVRGDFQISNIGFLLLWPVYSRALPSSSWKLAGNAAKPRQARRARGQHIGRPKALNKPESDLARRVHASGESASTIAATLSVSRATVYRVFAEKRLGRSESSGNDLRRRRGSAPCGLSRQLRVVDYPRRLVPAL
jgi:hypothetical protein